MGPVVSQVLSDCQGAGLRSTAEIGTKPSRAGGETGDGNETEKDGG